MHCFVGSKLCVVCGIRNFYVFRGIKFVCVIWRARERDREEEEEDLDLLKSVEVCNSKLLKRERKLPICSWNSVWKFCTSAKSLKRGQLEDLLATAVWKFAAANCWRHREREREKQEDLQHLSASHKAGTRKIWLLDQLACIYSFGTRLCILAYTLQNDLAPTFAVGVGNPRIV
jgi:hypothetical protein